ncbi:MAG: Crp/Fnr family transcriptional regulator [SAR202 cluster bacterium]|nr:Crp/Fnr family transcriptional regulator [SAR202 cluster bacterium]
MEPSLLAKLPYFERVGAAELEAIAPHVRMVERGPGEVLFHEGDVSRGLYFLIEGTVKVSRISPEGREQVLTVVGPWQTFNDVAVFDGGPCPATATALEPCVAGLLAGDFLRRLINAHPAVAEGMLRVFAGRLRGLAGLVADLTQLDVAGRVAKTLIAYTQASGQRSFTIGQQDLASIVGTTREVVARTLRTCEERGAIRRLGNSVEIVSLETLQSILLDSSR